MIKNNSWQTQPLSLRCMHTRISFARYPLHRMFNKYPDSCLAALFLYELYPKDFVTKSRTMPFPASQQDFEYMKCILAHFSPYSILAYIKMTPICFRYNFDASSVLLQSTFNTDQTNIITYKI